MTARGRALAVAVGLYAAGALSGPHTALGQSPRVRYTINDGWRYADGPLDGAQSPAYDDARWVPITIPHTWNAEDAFTKSLGYRRGVGWYRRRLTLDPSVRARRVFLYFEGANQVADIYVDGRHAGRHVGGYTAFAFDVTDLVRFDASTVVAVRVDNSHDPDIPPLNADFTFYGGIYRDVWLIATDPVHIDVLDHASPGVFIDTPFTSATSARVSVRGTVVNRSTTKRRVEAVHRVIDAAGREVAVLRSPVDVAAGGRATFRATSPPIRGVKLWSPSEPHVYRVRTEIVDVRRIIDRVENPVGFRRVAVDAGRGLLLNGEPLRLTGTNRHQDRAGFANALPNWAHAADIALVKENGFNFVRLAHYPQDPVVLAETDRRGLAVWEEIPVVNIITPSAAFAEHAERMLVEMIRQHYNHPSVLMWGYMNEVMLVKPDPMPARYREHVVTLAKRLGSRVKAEDSTRATVTAISFDEIDNGTGLQDIPDILGLNLYFGWYYRDLAGFGPFLDSLHRRHPRRPLFISEYGADSDERIHTLAPRAFDFSTEHQQRFHESHLPQIRDRTYLVGSAVWNQFDFGVKARHDSKANLNQKGLYYFDRTPKDVAFLYRAALREEPVLHIASRDWRLRGGSSAEDREQPVVVYSNLDEIELFLGKRSLGRRKAVNHVARWTVPFVDGDNRLRALGARNGTPVEDAITVRYDDRASFFSDARSSARTFAVNAGSHYQYVDAGGRLWEADRLYRPGSWGFEGGRERLIHHRIFGTSDDALFQAAREDVQGYRFDVPDGVYDVLLALTEVEHDRPGARVFSVRVNDELVLTDLDLAASYGRYVAVERTVRVEASRGRGIAIRFEPRVGSPIVSGILLTRH